MRDDDKEAAGTELDNKALERGPLVTSKRSLSEAVAAHAGSLSASGESGWIRQLESYPQSLAFGPHAIVIGKGVGWKTMAADSKVNAVIPLFSGHSDILLRRNVIWRRVDDGEEKGCVSPGRDNINFAP